MAKKTDGLLLTLSEDEVRELWTIIEPPTQSTGGKRWIAELIIVLTALLALGWISPGLVAAIVEWATPLLAL